MISKIQQSLASFPLARKLTLMAVLLVVPTIVVGALFYYAQDVQIRSARKQLAGLRFARPFVGLLKQMGAHRDAAAAVLAGQGGGAGPIRDIQPEVDRALQAVKDGAGASAGFQAEALTAEIAEGWESNLKPNWNTGNATISVDMHTLVLAQVGDVIRLVGRGARGDDASAAATPFDYSLLFSLPGSLESLGQLSAFSMSISRQPSLTGEQWDRLAGLTQDVRRTAELLRSALIAAGKAPQDEAGSQLKALTEAAAISAESLLDATQEASAGRIAFRADPMVYRALASQSLTAMAGLESKLAAHLESNLEARLSSLTNIRNIEIFAVTLLMALALGLGYLITSTASRQVRSMASVFSRISEGHLDARAEVAARDELGSFAQALNLVLDNTVALVQSRQERDRIQRNISKLLSEMEGVAQGDLTKEAEVTEEMTGAIAESFNVMLVELRGLIRRVQDSTLAVNSAAAGAQDVTLRLADGSEAQAAQILHATAAVDQMTLSIQQVTKQAAAAARIAQDALRNAQLGAQSARETIDGMGLVKQQVNEMASLVRELGESSVQIGDITQLIADISKRTSILALNASIQAAVAGESGKGFGVVAEQVEELATRSSDAARRVAQLTKSIQTSTGSVIEAMGGATRQAAGGEELATEASRRLAEIETVSRQLAGVVESILSACRQQSASSESIAQSMGEISRVTKRTSAGVQTAAGSIESLSNLVEELRGSVSRFRLPSATV